VKLPLKTPDGREKTFIFKKGARYLLARDRVKNTDFTSRQLGELKI
jgi:hypothetical protein